MTKILPALPALPSLTNRSLLSKREGNLKSGQCNTILDWLSEHAELGFESIGESPQIGSDWALCVRRHRNSIKANCPEDIFRILRIRSMSIACALFEQICSVRSD